MAILQKHSGNTLLSFASACILLIVFFNLVGHGMNLPNSVMMKSIKLQEFHTYRVDGRIMRYVEVSDTKRKPLIIFIHGSPGGWGAWSRYLNDPDLKKQAHMIAVDRPGYGGSGKGMVELSLVEQARDIAPLLDKGIPGQRVLLVGHSFGGPVVGRLAMDYGKKITDILILAGSIDPSQERITWYQYPADWPIFTWMIPDDLLVCNREIRALKNELTNMLPLWSEVTQRVTAIQGEKDRLVPAENADFPKRVMTKARKLGVIRLPYMGHFLPWKTYDLVKSEILKHLK